MQGAKDDELLQLLLALCSSEKGPRTAAEQTLASAKLQPGFCARLASFAAAGSATSDLSAPRQMGLTILRRLTLEHWTELVEADRTAVRGALLAMLAERSKALRSLSHACVANVRARGGPWPELQAHVESGIVNGTAHEASCCLECMGLLLEECSFEVAASLSPLQGPMLTLAASDSTDPAVRRECVNAHMAGITAILAGGDAPEAAAESIVRQLPAWLDVHAKLCVGLEGWGDADRLACAFTAVRTVTSFSRIRPLEDALACGLESVLRPACLLTQRIEPAYGQRVIMQDDGGQSEEDGGASQFVTQLIELVQSMLTKAKLRALLKGHMRSMLQLFVPFMRITEAQVKAWHNDPNEFLSHEEDDYARGCAVRLSTEGLVGELLSHSKREGMHALAAVAGELLKRSGQGHSVEEPGAWKFAEVALFLFALAAGEVQPRALQRGQLAPLAPVALGFAGRLCADATAPELLRARAFAVLRRLGDVVCELVPADLPALLRAAAAALGSQEPYVVRVCACRAFCRFLSAVDDTPLREALLLEHGVLASLGCLMHEANDEVLHLTLESMCVIVKQCPSAALAAEATLVPLILEIWQRCVADPMVHLQVLDLVSCAAASDPRLRLSMEVRLLPTIKANLCPGVDAHLTASAIELYGVLLQRTSVPLNTEVWDGVQPLLAAVMRSDESGLLQNACEVLCCLVKRSPGQLSHSACLEPLFRCLERLLGPDLDDDACLNVGNLGTLMLSQFAMSADLVLGFLKALVTRLARAERPYLKQELVVVLARLLCQDLEGVVTALSGMQVGSQNGLMVLLSIWLAEAKDIRARSARSVTLSALCRLHEHCLQDPQLQALWVGGAPLTGRLLAAIVAGLEFENGRCQRLREHGSEMGDTEDGDDSSGESSENGEGACGKLLSELVDLNTDAESDDASEGDAAFVSNDPFHKLNLRAMAAEYLAKHADSTSGQAELSNRLNSAVAQACAGS